MRVCRHPHPPRARPRPPNDNVWRAPPPRPPAEALEFYARRRTANAQGVTIPCQRRYCEYVERALRGGRYPAPLFGAPAPAFYLRQVRRLARLLRMYGDHLDCMATTSTVWRLRLIHGVWRAGAAGGAA